MKRDKSGGRRAEVGMILHVLLLFSRDPRQKIMDKPGPALVTEFVE